MESMKRMERRLFHPYRYTDRFHHRGRMMDKYKYLRHSRRTASARRSLFPEIWNCLSPRMIGRILTILFTRVYAQLVVKKSVRSLATRNRNAKPTRDKTDESKRHWEPFLIPLCPHSFNDCEQARVTFSITAFISRRVRVQSNWLKLDRFVCFFHSLLGLSGLLVFLPSCTTR